MARGGKREGAGRPKGKLSQAKRDIAEAAREHADIALSVVLEIAQNGDTDATRLSAARELLDRGFGKSPQAIDVQSSDGSLKPLTINLVAPKPKDAD